MVPDAGGRGKRSISIQNIVEKPDDSAITTPAANLGAEDQGLNVLFH